MLIGEVRLPNEETEIDATKYDKDDGRALFPFCDNSVFDIESEKKKILLESGGFNGAEAKVEIVIKINHDGEINR